MPFLLLDVSFIMQHNDRMKTELDFYTPFRSTGYVTSDAALELDEIANRIVNQHRSSDVLEAAFAKAMEGCNYGEEETRDAKAWFTLGFKAALPAKAPCRECNDTGLRDSGGVYPWGEYIFVPCGCGA